jgi:hypothetical protein
MNNTRSIRGQLILCPLEQGEDTWRLVRVDTRLYQAAKGVAAYRNKKDQKGSSETIHDILGRRHTNMEHVRM